MSRGFVLGVVASLLMFAGVLVAGYVLALIYLEYTNPRVVVEIEDVEVHGADGYRVEGKTLVVESGGFTYTMPLQAEFGPSDDAMVSFVGLLVMAVVVLLVIASLVLVALFY